MDNMSVCCPRSATNSIVPLGARLSVCLSVSLCIVGHFPQMRLTFNFPFIELVIRGAVNYEIKSRMECGDRYCFYLELDTDCWLEWYRGQRAMTTLLFLMIYMEQRDGRVWPTIIRLSNECTMGWILGYACRCGRIYLCCIPQWTPCLLVEHNMCKIALPKLENS